MVHGTGIVRTHAERPVSGPSLGSWRRLGCLILIAFFVLLVLVVMPEPLTLVPWTILTGWITVVGDVIPRMTWNWEMIVTGLVCLAGFIAGFHWFAGWMYRHHSPEGRWPWRWSLSVTMSAILLFCSGIAVIGLVHQTTWLTKTNEPMVRYDMLRHPRQITRNVDMMFYYGKEKDAGFRLTGEQVRKELPEMLHDARSPEVRVTVLSGPDDALTALVVDLRRTAIGKHHGICYYRWNGERLEMVHPTESQVAEFIADAQAGRSLERFAVKPAP